MDSLVAIGSSVSYLYGFAGLMQMAYGYGTMNHELIHSSMDMLYFESAAMIVTLVSLGKYLEARSKSKTGDALAKLVQLAPKTAWVKRNDTFVEIPVEQVQAKDLIKIVPGATIPVDGIVVSGTGTVIKQHSRENRFQSIKKPAMKFCRQRRTSMARLFFKQQK